ncbi:hypothetical protein B0T25DRAFT_538263, partial [Lasiosphaeria hispida]
MSWNTRGQALPPQFEAPPAEQSIALPSGQAPGFDPQPEASSLAQPAHPGLPPRPPPHWGRNPSGQNAMTSRAQHTPHRHQMGYQHPSPAGRSPSLPGWSPSMNTMQTPSQQYQPQPSHPVQSFGPQFPAQNIAAQNPVPVDQPTCPQPLPPPQLYQTFTYQSIYSNMKFAPQHQHMVSQPPPQFAAAHSPSTSIPSPNFSPLTVPSSQSRATTYSSPQLQPAPGSSPLSHVMLPSQAMPSPQPQFGSSYPHSYSIMVPVLPSQAIPSPRLQRTTASNPSHTVVSSEVSSSTQPQFTTSHSPPAIAAASILPSQANLTPTRPPRLTRARRAATARGPKNGGSTSEEGASQYRSQSQPQQSKVRWSSSLKEKLGRRD